MHLLGQRCKQIQSLDRPEGINQRILVVCLRYSQDRKFIKHEAKRELFPILSYLS